MKEVSEMLFKYFTSLEVFKNEMKDKLYPLYVSNQKEFPFAVYNIGEVPYLTKDARSFPVTLSLCYQPEKYSEALDFADKMKDAVEDIDEFVEECGVEYMSTQTLFDEENEYVYVSINFNVIK
ncbi:MAG: hypothetical protein LBE34_13900 [Flavobacteriaceae bacterium]|jgi:hypothetical protein|nr:hypothetical protein [Flavobacteriaceae bacterium]